jgi:hypothetical protein
LLTPGRGYIIPAMPTIPTLTPDGIVEVPGHILKLGTGKKALPTLGIRSDTKAIIHLASGKALTFGASYLSTSKKIASELLTLMGEKLLDPLLSATQFDDDILSYLRVYWGDCKDPPGFEDWLDGIDSTSEANRNSLGRISGEPAGEYAEELLDGDTSPMYVLARHGDRETLIGVDLLAIVRGEPTYR